MKILGMGMPELLIILAVILLIFGPKNLPKLGGAIGKTVKNQREGMGGAESDAAAGKISNESPVGSVLLGHKKGDVVETTGPTGRKITMTILKLEH